jgi:type II secretion system protein L
VILLAALIGLHFVGKAAEWQLLKKRENQVDASIRDTFRSAMQGEANSADARRRMEQRLAAARGAGGGLLPALQALAQARSAVPDMSVQGLNFHDGSLEMKLSAHDAASLDRLSQAFRNDGWHADLTSGSNAASGYEGRIQVRASGT